MFFYLYIVIELLAIFLDSNIIPTANASYPVRAPPIITITQSPDVLFHSGLLQYTQASSQLHTAAFSSTDLLVFNSQKMAHRCHFGYVPSRSLSSLVAHSYLYRTP